MAGIRSVITRQQHSPDPRELPTDFDFRRQVNHRELRSTRHPNQLSQQLASAQSNEMENSSQPKNLLAARMLAAGFGCAEHAARRAERQWRGLKEFSCSETRQEFRFSLQNRGAESPGDFRYGLSPRH